MDRADCAGRVLEQVSEDQLAFDRPLTENARPLPKVPRPGARQGRRVHTVAKAANIRFEASRKVAN
jgi:hypothetical protein